MIARLTLPVFVSLACLAASSTSGSTSGSTSSSTLADDAAASAKAQSADLPKAAELAPLVIGDTFVVDSQILDEERRINVYRPAAYDQDPAVSLPVLYMPDGGTHEDFLHIAGLVQISSLNTTMRPFLLVGIENTNRRRDLTGPTTNEEDLKMAPLVGRSSAFRTFIRDELMPVVEATYRTTEEKALIGESLAGLFTVETLLLEPDLFDTYIAIDPSLWWNDAKMVASARKSLEARGESLQKTLYLASSDMQGIAEPTARLHAVLESLPGLQAHYSPMPDEHHHTIYHPAALQAIRVVFAQPTEGPSSGSPESTPDDSSMN